MVATFSLTTACKAAAFAYAAYSNPDSRRSTRLIDGCRVTTFEEATPAWERLLGDATCFSLEEGFSVRLLAGLLCMLILITVAYELVTDWLEENVFKEGSERATLDGADVVPAVSPPSTPVRCPSQSPRS